MTENEFLNQIDDYATSVHAIVGFANFYLWDPATKTNISGVIVFQGRHLSPVTPRDDGAGRTGAYVTPDLGVLLPNRSGVLAEVKLSFPMDQSHWMADFGQLMAYDAELTGWPSADGRVGQHDVVLITEQGRAVRVRKFYEQRAGREIVFSRPFVIMSVNRSDNRQPYYFFQRILGTLTDSDLDAYATDGSPSFPKKSWVTDALEQYVSVRQAEWIDAKKDEIRVFFERLDDPLRHFIAGCCRSQAEEHQTSNQQLRLPFGDE